MNACTIVARNYLPYARVLAATFLEHNPQGRFTTLVLDGHDDLAEQFDIVGPYDIGIERTELHRMAMIYDLKELATAVKPWFLRQLATNGETSAMYFDPDIAVYAPLEELGALAQRHSILLTPHTTVPIPDDGCLPDEKMILQAGIYNLGFIAIGAGSEGFLAWWSDHLKRHCIVAVEQALFVDQRWVDFVPALFEHDVVVDPGYNVAYWNLHGRHLTSAGPRYQVDGEPLRFFHFSGFKPETPHVLSHHMGTRPRILLSRHRDLARLCREYGHQVLERGYGGDATPYTFAQLPGGIHIDRAMRRLFRADLLEAEHDGREPPLDPFDPSSTASFVESLREPAKGSRGCDISRYAYALYSDRPDLQKAFPDVFGADASGFVRWLHDSGQAQKGLVTEMPTRSLVRGVGVRGRAVTTRTVNGLEKRLRSVALSHPTLARGKPVWRAVRRVSAGGGDRSRAAHGVVHRQASPIEVASHPTHGVNLIGYLSAELGIGEVARKILLGLEHTAIDYSTVAYHRTLSRQAHRFDERRAQQAPFDTNIICVNADQLPIFREDVGPALFSDRHTIGVWFWEVSEFPAAFHGAFGYVDEIWVATRFVRDAIAAKTSKPVAIVPLPLEVPPVRKISRAELGLPDDFFFLFSFDFLSVLERKNPLGLVEAFTRAFADGEGPVLVLKSINGEHDLQSLERLRLAVASRMDIQVIDGYFGPEEKNALMAECDCYVSLHRSEGFGLTMAEAMAYGKPVIATGYSGNTDFMDESNSHLVPHSLVPIPRGCDPYPTGAMWAEPDLDAAASAMRDVYEDQDAARKLGAHARSDVLARFSLDRTASFLTERLAAPQTVQVTADSKNGSRVTHTAAEPLAFASSKVALGPGGYFARAKRHRPGVGPLRAALRRMLWPYILDQHELSVSLVDAIGRLQGELEAMTLEARRQEVSDAGLFSGIQGELSRLASELAAAPSTPETGVISHLQAELERLESELYASPYVSDPGAVALTDAEGRSVIGYDLAEGDAAGLYRGFEDTFRGSEDFIRDRQRVYLDLIRGHGSVLDVGCGRGELLELLAEAGISATGVDIDQGMVARCHAKGLAVELADFASYLESRRDQSLGVIFSAQVIEHFSFETLDQFFRLATDKLIPGGLFIAETVNPHSVQAFKTFWVDPTHRAPIFPEVAVTLARLHGFASARVLFPLGTGELEVDRRNQGEYALVATWLDSTPGDIESRDR